MQLATSVKPYIYWALFVVAAITTLFFYLEDQTSTPYAKHSQAFENISSAQPDIENAVSHVFDATEKVGLDIAALRNTPSTTITIPRPRLGRPPEVPYAPYAPSNPFTSNFNSKIDQFNRITRARWQLEQLRIDAEITKIQANTNTRLAVLKQESDVKLAILATSLGDVSTMISTLNLTISGLFEKVRKLEKIVQPSGSLALTYFPLLISLIGMIASFVPVIIQLLRVNSEKANIALKNENLELENQKLRTEISKANGVSA